MQEEAIEIAATQTFVRLRGLVSIALRIRVRTNEEKSKSLNPLMSKIFSSLLPIAYCKKA